ERFEEAARYRNRLFSVRHLAERQAADKRAVGTIDVIGIAAEADRAAVQVFPLRDGRLIDRYGFHLENAAGQDMGQLLETFCLEYYCSSPSVPPQIVVPPDAGDTSALEAFLSEQRGSRVEVRAPVRGEKRRLPELATGCAEALGPGGPGPFLLAQGSAGLQLLRRVRGEAHRFAFGFHRQRRDARAKESIFDTLPGVGPARRRALIRHFGSAERFLEA